jgi:hypothetical protein
MNHDPTLRSRLAGISLIVKSALCLFLAAVTVSFPACTPGGMGPYRLEQMGNELVVLPPPYSNRARGKAIRIDLPAIGESRSENGTRCSVASGPFKLTGTVSGWKVALPSLRTWSRESARGVFLRHFEGFISQIDALAGKGCISARDAVHFEEAIREAVPATVHDTMLYRYRYRSGSGFVNLEPGMRVMIQRAEYNRSGEFQGSETVYYRVSRDSRGELHFRPVKTEHQGRARILPDDLDLGDRIHSSKYARLFLSGNLVPRNLNYAALVIAARNLKELDSMTRELEKRPQAGCPAPSKNEVVCKPYSGLVTVIAELRVRVNGKKHFVSLGANGANLRGVLEEAGKSPCVADPHSLRIKREFLGHPAPLVFNSATDAIMYLTVVANDRIHCSTGNSNSGKR